MTMNRFLLCLCLGLTPLTLSAQFFLDPALLTKPPTDAWPTYNGDYSGRRFSTLTQINQSNVKQSDPCLDFPRQAGITPNGAIVGGEGRHLEGAPVDPGRRNHQSHAAHGEWRSVLLDPRQCLGG